MQLGDQSWREYAVPKPCEGHLRKSQYIVRCEYFVPCNLEPRCLCLNQCKFGQHDVHEHHYQD